MRISLLNVPNASQVRFLDNEYIGAPWKHPVPPCPNGVGNGGFSLRDIRAMLRITKGSRPDQLPEDVRLVRTVVSLKAWHDVPSLLALFREFASPSTLP